MSRKFIRSLREFLNAIAKKNISAFSASTAFFFFLSLFPMLAVICAVLPYTPLSAENLLFVIEGYVPDLVNPLVRVIVADVYAQSAGILSIAIVSTLWSAGKGVLALIRGLNIINDVVENRNYFVLRAVSSFYTLIMIIVIILSLFLMVFGNLLINLFLKNFPQLAHLFELLMHFRFVFSWLVLTLIFTMIYTFVPNKKMQFREQWTGGMFAAVIWSIFAWCFSMYVDQYGGFGTYGSLATIVITMLYLYFCMYIILLGAYINSYFKKKGGAKKIGIN